MNAKVYFTGIDIGSTTIKLAVYDEEHLLVHSAYRRHHALAVDTLHALLGDVRAKLGNAGLNLMFTGSAGIGMAERAGFPFVQEVIVSADYLRNTCPEVRTFIEIGGEDAKVVFFDDEFHPQIRMNGSCAGGTGAFIEQMAVLLDVPLQDFDRLAEESASLYSIASRCGVFAKTDIQSLLSNRVAKEDIAASVFHAMALQVIASLVRGSEIKRKVLFAGGPLTFFPQLRMAFMRVLQLDAERDVAFSLHPELIAASGAALFHGESRRITNIAELQQLLMNVNRKRVDPHGGGELPPLFRNPKEREEWEERHRGRSLPRLDISDLDGGPCFLGIDSGSTTTKMVLIDEGKRVIMAYYAANQGDSIGAVNKGMAEFHERCRKAGKLPHIARTAATGYGEELVMAAFGIDDGVVETMAHYRAAKYFTPEVSFILDIGGQDMKAIYVRDNMVADVQINEACSSGCGSFLETFARSMNYDVVEFARLACEKNRPFDLGTRCTVFMNSRVRQALKEGATVADISAGLAYAVVKNTLYKVLKLRDPAALGEHIVVQGGTFCNPAVLRALELLLEREVVRPDMSEMMGAFGAALTALNNYRLNNKPPWLVATTKHENPPLPPFGKGGMGGFSYRSVAKFKGLGAEGSQEAINCKTFSCRGCENKCPVTKLTFATGLSYVSGNRCERYFSNGGRSEKPGENLIERKLALLFECPTAPDGPPRLTFGVPRVLNMYENFPFWCAFLTACGFEVALSAPSRAGLFEKGVGTVMSDNVCFPAKLAHGHIVDLIERGVDRIFYPTVVYEGEEYPHALNSYNCPIVTGYPDVIRSAVDPEGGHGIPIDSPVISFMDIKLLKKQLYAFFKPFGIRKNTVCKATNKAFSAQRAYKTRLRELTESVIRKAADSGRLIMVVAGRPYHIDPLVNHGIPALLSGLGVDVVPEDGLPVTSEKALTDSGILTQWAYANRIISAANYVASGKLSGMLQLTSFGCGLDALVADEARDIIAGAGRVYSLIKMDEITNPGAVRIRLRALVEAIGERTQGAPPARKATGRVFTSGREEKERTIIAPWFSPYYSPFIPAVFGQFGYTLELLPPQERPSVETGLKYVNNDMCYPAIVLVGDVIRAMKSGRYEPRHTSVMLAQTFGQCRASSYVPLLRKALTAAGFGEASVISIAAGDAGLHFALEADRKEFVERLALGLIFSDVLNSMVLATTPHEIRRGEAAAIRDMAMVEMLNLLNKGTFQSMLSALQEAVAAFNRVAVDDAPLPVIGVLGEIFVKYNPFSNQNMVGWLTEQGVEVVLPSLVNFFTQRFVNEEFDQSAYIKRSLKDRAVSRFLDAYVRYYLRQVEGAMRNFRYYRKSHDLHELAAETGKVTSLANQSGEGWLLTAEMIAMLKNGIEHIICLQPFGCLANHITGKGVEKRMKSLYPRLNLHFLDMDAGISEVNVLNRLHFMLARAK
ncbi:MAG: acyl-CoA dehydratase activase, partial [Syntrophales bacterium]|nr:acyl-CoA dehydratase activase [Syntrophales bacterium]